MATESWKLTMTEDKNKSIRQSAESIADNIFGRFLHLSGGSNRQAATHELLLKIFERYSKLANDFNNSNRQDVLEIKILSTVAGKDVSRSNTLKSGPSQPRYGRILVTTSLWALSVRGKNGVVEIFSVPACEATVLSSSETASRLKVRLELKHNINGINWTLSGLVVDENEPSLVASDYLMLKW